MKNSTFSKVISAAALSLVFISPALSEPAAVKELVTSHNSFAMDLYQALNKDGENLFFSPLSISTALAMTYAGAKNQTAQQMQEVLHNTGNQDAYHEGNEALRKLLQKSALIQANSLWPDKNENLLDSFLYTLQKQYGAQCQPLEFATDPELAASVINDWVAENTLGRVQDLLQPHDITADTRLVLANAMVFDGQWQEAFDPAMTRPMAFYLADGTILEIPGMHRKSNIMIASWDDFKLVELPFKGNETSLLMVVPNMRGGLPAIEDFISAEAINLWVKQLKSREVSLALPRFEMNERVDLSEVLIGLGMDSAFSPDADFTGISEDKGLFIGKILHQAAVKINEEGVEAAAATAVIMKRESVAELLQINRPFLFMIRHKETGSILFMGRMADPRP